jgi:16S rRNA A1518/A1519 N6-dimethyltransferase RsmA/KsgA/DIM1 with predicted DNA glycosylase/AP lyase activity
MLQEIYHDEFWNQLNFWSKKISPCTILEIGGGTGDGSTTAFFEAIEQGSKVYSIEARHDRYEELKKKPVHALFGCSVAKQDYMTKRAVKKFYKSYDTKINQTPLKTVLQWRKEELDVIKNIPQNVAAGINAEFVFIDGSPFTAQKEFHYTVVQNPNVKIVALDDINDIKNFDNFQILNTSANWSKVWENFELRNGAAIFAKK